MVLDSSFEILMHIVSVHGYVVRCTGPARLIARINGCERASNKGRRCKGGLWWWSWSLGGMRTDPVLFIHPYELKVKVKSTKVSDKPCGQSIELYLLSATFDQPVFNFSHPLCDVQFCVFVEEISSVQLTVQLIDKVGTC